MHSATCLSIVLPSTEGPASQVSLSVTASTRRQQLGKQTHFKHNTVDTEHNVSLYQSAA